MADSPGGADIKVTPSAIDAAASEARRVAGAVRATASVLATSGAGVVGDPGCADVLASTSRLIAAAAGAAADGVEALAQALCIAPGSYRLADQGAIPMMSR